MHMVVDRPTDLQPGKSLRMRTTPYQGPSGFIPPPGYTFWTQRATLEASLGVTDEYGNEYRKWKVTVYYTKVDDPLAPLKEVTMDNVPSSFDLRTHRKHEYMIDKLVPDEQRPGSQKPGRFLRLEVTELDLDKAASVERENQARARAREIKRQKQRKLEEELKQRWRTKRIEELETQQRAEIEHAKLIEEHRAQWRKDQEDQREAEAAQKTELDEARRQWQEQVRKEREDRLQAERETKETARAAAEEQAAEVGTQRAAELSGRTSFEEGDPGLEEVATGDREVAKKYIKYATEPEHVTDAINLLGDTMTYSSSEEVAEVLESAAPKQAEFVEETITKILTRPDDASLETRKEHAKELGQRLDTYMRLPGTEPIYEERAKTRFFRELREIRDLEEHEAEQALQGQSQIDQKSQGLGNTGVPPQHARKRKASRAGQVRAPQPPAESSLPIDLDQGHPPPM